MKYAVILLKGHQYKVSEGEEVLVDRMDKAACADVLLVADGEKVAIGKPKLNKATVELSLVGEEKGDKLHVYKYKSKSRYRKKRGFRASLTRVRVDHINI